MSTAAIRSREAVRCRAAPRRRRNAAPLRLGLVQGIQLPRRPGGPAGVFYPGIFAKLFISPPSETHGCALSQ